MRGVLVVTENEYLAQKITLALRGICEVTLDRNMMCDLCILDLDTARISDGEVFALRTVTVGREGADIALPLAFEELLSLVSVGEGKKRLELRCGVAFVDGIGAKLTDVESALLARLIEAGGAFVSRDELLRAVWHGEADGGVLNVYIHYLREKLERGEKIIISSRGEGYKIDGRFLNAEDN